MRILVKECKAGNSPIDAIKTLRNCATNNLSLVTAKSFVELLPLDIDIDPDRLEEFKQVFRVEYADPQTDEKLFTAWAKLDIQTKSTLLQYLYTRSLLQVE
jgi:hypothetical protein